MKSDLRITAVVLGLLLLGCDRVPTRPEGSTLPVRFTLTTSSRTGDPAHPVSLRARVTNVGGGPIIYTEGCSGPGIPLIVRAPDRGNIVDACVECRNYQCPGCADRIVTLGPGQSVEAEGVFDGTLYHCDGPYAGPGGMYTVEATFRPLAPDGDGSVSITRSQTFSWSATAP